MHCIHRQLPSTRKPCGKTHALLQEIENVKKSAEEETARVRKEAESAAEQFAAQQRESLAQIQAERDQATKREREAVEKLKAERSAAESRALEAAAKLRRQQDDAALQLKQLQVLPDISQASIASFG